MARGLLWSRRAASRELRAWRDQAAAIPDASIRTDALEAIDRKRDNVEGASLFSILPKHRDGYLLKLLVAYQVLWDFLDSISERGAHAGQTNGRQLHRALVEALDLEAPISDYYRHHPWKNDGGYLLALVETCRSMCTELPSYHRVRRLMLDGVARCAIQSLNHEPEPHRRDVALRQWTEHEYSDEHGLKWFELAAAASAFTPHVLLALASEPSCEHRELVAVHSTYFPWIALAITMLDSFVDLADDEIGASHSYIGHYDSQAVAQARLAEIIGQSIKRATNLPKGRRHAVLIEGIVAWYLSSNYVAAPEIRPLLIDAGGPLTRLLLPLARAWRATNARWPGRSAVTDKQPQSSRFPPAIQTYLIWRAPFAHVRRCRARYGNHFTMKITNFPTLVFLCDPSDVRAMLTASADVLHSGEGGAKIAPIVGESSFMLLDEREHLHGRKALLPALRPRAVHKDADRMLHTIRHQTASWPRDIGFPLLPRLRRLTMDIILRRVFNDSELAPDDRRMMLQEMLLAMLAVTDSVVYPLPILRQGPGRVVWRRFLRQRFAVDTLIHPLIDECRVMNDPDRDDVLTVLLAARNPDGRPLSRQQLRDNIVTMLASGHETTASQLAWAFQLLAHHPRVQRRLIEEIDKDTGERYLLATIQEVLRHRTVFPFTVPRAVKQPIEIGGWMYEPPAHLLGCIYLLHHDPDAYPEPEEFRPERFLEGQPSPQTWLPWGGGRRRCPGSHLALLEMKTVLRAVLETMTVNPASRRMERPRWRSVIVTPHAGSRVILRPRKRPSSVAIRTWRQAMGGCPATIHAVDLLEQGP
jgi:cytochrome P450